MVYSDLVDLMINNQFQIDIIEIFKNINYNNWLICFILDRILHLYQKMIIYLLLVEDRYLLVIK